jgi:sugar transferase (PEP-CTERM/EpsH1 system associated)
VLFRLGVGGLENGVVNLVNRLPRDAFRHSIVTITEAAEFRSRIEREDVQIHELRKPPGRSPAYLLELHRLLRTLRPDVLHTRNANALECQLAGWAARVPARVHGEHGWDVHDLHGTSAKYRWLRRLLAPFVHRFMTVSEELADYLRGPVGLASRRVVRVCNGVDTERFRPRSGAPPPAGWPFGQERVLCGVGRMKEVKDPLNLAEAYVRACVREPGLADRWVLVMVGDGPLREAVQDRLRRSGLLDRAWFPGSRDDVDAFLAVADLFVLPSRNEGISNTILEAMASGVPVIATAVGGSPELVDDGVTGRLVPAEDPEALASAFLDYARDEALRIEHGRNGRARCEREFSIEGMVERYATLYRTLHGGRVTRAGRG